MNYIYAYESAEETQRAVQSCSNLIKVGEEYRDYLINNYQLLYPASSLVFTTAEFANSVFGQSPLPAYNNGSRIVVSPNQEDWSNLYLGMFKGYDAPAELIEYLKDFGEKEVIQVYLHEITHDIELFVGEYGTERDDFWFEEGMCEYLSFRYIYDDQEYEKIIEMLSKLVEYFQGVFGEFDVEHFNEDIYIEGNVEYLLSFYAKAFLLVDQYVKECDGTKNLFEIYADWWNNDSKLTLNDWFKEKLN